MKISRYLMTLLMAVTTGCVNYAPTTVTVFGNLDGKSGPPIVIMVSPQSSAASAPLTLIDVAVAATPTVVAPPVLKGPTKAAAAALTTHQRPGCGTLTLPELPPPLHITGADLDKVKDPSNAIATSLALQNLLLDRLIRVSRYSDDLKKSWTQAVADHNKKCGR